ncbi:lysophospholipid acyltransferase family protein [Xanthomonas maliensis]|uniref:lysophospholipid acyltransferase family protein n=1 Tax=Xanthomonas maliensis TaxID=1321368 RepID=UPI00039D628E|nr:lysophospholipid acyltransferase family protein [Xanthomonas maliensis]KAB7770567.1 1-acyl-sn-glycerol-3-phosphate acyltransferase [Xanthomonas maliensis]
MSLARMPSRLAWAVFNGVQLAFTLLVTVVGISLALLVAATGNTARALAMARWLWAPLLLRGAGAQLVVEGRERLDWSQTYLFVSNHQSIIDICALFRALPVPLRFLLKEEMLQVPFVNWYARATGMLFLDRDSRRAGALVRRQAAALLRDGHHLCLFPEGTRSRSGALLPFKAGLLQAAIDAGVAVVPIAVDGCGKVLPVDGLFRVRPGTIRLRIGAPIPVTGPQAPDRQQLAEQAHRTIAAMLQPRI